MHELVFTATETPILPRKYERRLALVMESSNLCSFGEVYSTARLKIQEALLDCDPTCSPLLLDRNHEKKQPSVSLHIKYFVRPAAAAAQPG